MRLWVLVSAIAMPVVALLALLGLFGPDPQAISERYPSLLLASDYVRATWALIFLLDLAYAVWQFTGTRRDDATLSALAPWATAAFFLTALWMPLFALATPGNGLFWVCLVLLFVALACLVRCAAMLSFDTTPHEGQRIWAWTPLSVHAGWLSVSVWLNASQALSAHGLVSDTQMLPWSLVLYAAMAVLLLLANQRMYGNPDYAGAAIWGLVAIFLKQSGWDVPGAGVAGWVALGIAAVLLVQTLYLQRKYPNNLMPGSARAG